MKASKHIKLEAESVHFDHPGEGVMDGVRADVNFSKKLIGLLLQQGRDGVVELDRTSPEAGRKIFIPRRDLNGAPFGMKVIVELTGIADLSYGRIVEVLGDPGNPDVAIQSIIHTYGLSEDFPPEVLREVEDLPSDPDEAEIQAELERGRRDLRDYHTITIDGLDARDLDDAIDVSKTANGYELWVHIADVTHYVRPGSALNKEAVRRGNSVYLVDRVLPMYPPKLSNGLCSLNPGKDRFCLSAHMNMDQNGRVKGGEIVPSVIRSKVRSSYEELTEIFAGAAVQSDRPDWFSKLIETARELAGKLNHLRKKRGALAFNFPETKVKLDPQGKPLEIYGKWQNESNEIIEAFMVAANEFVAEFCEKKHLPVVYRVHEEPDPDKLSAVGRLAREQGLRLKVSAEPKPREVQKMLEELKAAPVGPALSELVLRAQAKARYDIEDLGHFGLASEAYLHFTSPIRRYADDVVHRAVKAALQQEKLGALKLGLKEIAWHISLTERTAEQAERDSVQQKIVEYYAEHLGEVFAGRVSGFSNSGLFVQLANTAEGSVLFASLDECYIDYDPDRLEASSRQSGLIFRIGDRVRVQIARVDLLRRFLDFTLLEHEDAVSGEVREIQQKEAPGRKQRTQNLAEKASRKGSKKSGKSSKKDTSAKKSRKNKKAKGGSKKHRKR